MQPEIPFLLRLSKISKNFVVRELLGIFRVKPRHRKFEKWPISGKFWKPGSFFQILEYINIGKAGKVLIKRTSFFITHSNWKIFSSFLHYWVNPIQTKKKKNPEMLRKSLIHLPTGHRYRGMNTTLQFTSLYAVKLLSIVVAMQIILTASSNGKNNDSILL